MNKNIVHELQPYKMDEDTLIYVKSGAIEIKSTAYRMMLKEMVENTEYEKYSFDGRQYG